MAGAALLVLGLITILLAGSVLSAPRHRPVGAPPVELPGDGVAFAGAEGAVLRGWYTP